MESTFAIKQTLPNYDQIKKISKDMGPMPNSASSDEFLKEELQLIWRRIREPTNILISNFIFSFLILLVCWARIEIIEMLFSDQCLITQIIIFIWSARWTRLPKTQERRCLIPTREKFTRGKKADAPDTGSIPRPSGPFQ